MWLRHLAANGHACRVVSAALDADAECTHDGIEIRSVKDLPRRTPVLHAEIQEFAPDFVLVSSEDLSHVLLREAVRARSGTPGLPGPHAAVLPLRSGELESRPEGRGAGAGSARHRRHRNARRRLHPGSISASRPAWFIRRCTASPPYPRFGDFDNGWLLMINPCAVKGLPIFLDLARRFPAAAVRRAGRMGNHVRRPAGDGRAAQYPTARDRAEDRRRAGRIATAADAVALVRRLRADRDGGDAARVAGDRERLGRARGSQARHRLRGSGAADRALSAGVRRDPHAAAR